MSDLRERRLTRIAVTRRVRIFRIRNTEYEAHVGNPWTGVVNVPGKQNTIYVTIDLTGRVLEAVNRGILAALGTTVIVGYEPENPNQLVVLRYWNAFGTEENPTEGVKNHGWQHQWRNGIVAGGDISYIWGEQFMPMLYKASGLNVIIHPGHYRTPSGTNPWKRYKKRKTVNLTTHVPSTPGKARYVLVVVSAAGAFAVRDGTDVTGYDNLTDADLPEPTAGDNVICAVKLFYGQTVIRHSPAISDFEDLRWTGANGGGTAPLEIHGSEHTSIGGDPVPDVVSGGASGLMPGSDKAKLDAMPAEDVDLILITEDLSSQIDGVTYHFDTSAPMETWPIVTCSLEQLPNAVTAIDDDGMGFTLSILLTSPDTLTVKYLVQDNYIITDDDGNFIYDAEGSVILEV